MPVILNAWTDTFEEWHITDQYANLDIDYWF